MVAYFSGDMDTAWQVATEARERLRGIDDPWHVVDLVGLHGLLAHQRGEWYASFRTELRRTQGHERLAGAVFDAHLCVAENLLYGREPYPEIIAEAEQLRAPRQPGRGSARRRLRHRPDRRGRADDGRSAPGRGGAPGGGRAPRGHRRGRRSGPQHAAPGRGAAGPGTHRRGPAAAGAGAAARALVDHRHAPAATHLRHADRLRARTSRRHVSWWTGRRARSASPTSAGSAR